MLQIQPSEHSALQPLSENTAIKKHPLQVWLGPVKISFTRGGWDERIITNNVLYSSVFPKYTLL